MMNPVARAKEILLSDVAVPYGIFGYIASTGYFPPLFFLNEFFKVGYDPCDQDGRMEGWTPFTLFPEEYQEVKNWWVSLHPGAVEDQLGAGSWSDWLQEILEGTYGR